MNPRHLHMGHWRFWGRAWNHLARQAPQNQWLHRSTWQCAMTSCGGRRGWSGTAGAWAGLRACTRPRPLRLGVPRPPAPIPLQNPRRTWQMGQEKCDRASFTVSCSASVRGAGLGAACFALLNRRLAGWLLGRSGEGVCAGAAPGGSRGRASVRRGVASTRSGTPSDWPRGGLSSAGSSCSALVGGPSPRPIPPRVRDRAACIEMACRSFVCLSCSRNGPTPPRARMRM